MLLKISRSETRKPEFNSHSLTSICMNSDSLPDILWLSSSRKNRKRKDLEVAWLKNVKEVSEDAAEENTHQESLKQA